MLTNKQLNLSIFTYEYIVKENKLTTFSLHVIFPYTVYGFYRRFF